MLHVLLICAGLMLGGEPPAARDSLAAPPDNPRWKVLVLIYAKTDLLFSNDKGEHHFVGTMTNDEKSRDLKEWKPVADPGVSKLYGEGPKVFRFQDSYWLIKDPGKGLDVYRSPDLENWTYQGKILDRPGRRNDDATPGQHADVVVCGDRAYIIYFTHPDRQSLPPTNDMMSFAARRSSLPAAELEVRDGKLICDRDNPFPIRLGEPGSSAEQENR